MSKPSPKAIHEANKSSEALVRDLGIPRHFATGSASCACGLAFASGPVGWCSFPAVSARDKLIAHINAEVEKDPSNGVTRIPSIRIGGCVVEAHFDNDGYLNVSIMTDGADFEVRHTDGDTNTAVPVRVISTTPSLTVAS